MKKSKVIFVVNVNNYFPELCQYTLPTIKNYAKRIDADYVEITERKYPDFPPTYEKVQVHELGKDYEWCLLSDADNMIHPLAPDLTEGMSSDYVGFFSGFEADTLFQLDDCFAQDGRNVGIATGFVVTSKQCHDLWTPLEFDAETAKTKTKRWFIIDEYCLSRNLAKFKYKFTGLYFTEAVKSQFCHLGVEEKTPEEKSLIVHQAKMLSEIWRNLYGV